MEFALINSNANVQNIVFISNVVSKVSSQDTKVKYEITLLNTKT
jgi:hypothetical protein